MWNRVYTADENRTATTAWHSAHDNNIKTMIPVVVVVVVSGMQL